MSGKRFSLDGRCSVRYLPLSYLFIFLFLTSSVVQGSSLLGVFYLKAPYAHIHKKADIDSRTLTTISCGHPIKVYADGKLSHRWRHIKVAKYDGYIKQEMLSDKRPACWQDKYPRFFFSDGSFNL